MNIIQKIHHEFIILSINLFLSYNTRDVAED
jgi:hypothetical protein